MQPEPIIYDDDTRYPGPDVHPPPGYITGIPTQRELDAQARMFTWGELKGIVQLLMRNKKMQARYDTWMIGMKEKYGSTEAYLTQARLPWASNHKPQPTFNTSPQQAPSSPLLEPPMPLSPNTYPTTPPTGEPSPNVKDPNGGLKLDVSDGQLLKVRHGRTPSITVSPSQSSPPKVLLPPGPEVNGSPKKSPHMTASTTQSPGSGTSTPSSVGFVSLSSLNLVNGKLRKTKSRTSSLEKSLSHLDLSAAGEGNEGRRSELGEQTDGKHNGEEEEEEEEKPNYLRWDGWLDNEKYAVLPNDWPYNVPTGVRHYCVWSRIPIAHPDLVDYNPDAWSKIESEGLGGFTGVTPLFRRKNYPTFTPSPKTSPPQSGTVSPSTSTSGGANQVGAGLGRTKSLGHLEGDEWFAVDCDYSGGERRRWAGVGYESEGGKEVGKMVKGLWDERGWECLWFVNPPRLQSVPGFSHFHVFARRKTPEEIDAAEAAMVAAQKKGLKGDGRDTVPTMTPE